MLWLADQLIIGLNHTTNYVKASENGTEIIYVVQNWVHVGQGLWLRITWCHRLPHQRTVYSTGRFGCHVRAGRRRGCWVRGLDQSTGTCGADWLTSDLNTLIDFLQTYTQTQAEIHTSTFTITSPWGLNAPYRKMMQQSEISLHSETNLKGIIRYVVLHKLKSITNTAEESVTFKMDLHYSEQAAVTPIKMLCQINSHYQPSA